MNIKQAASTLVLYFYQGNGNKTERWITLANELDMPFTREDIEHGIAHVFFNDSKKWADYQREGGIGMQLYGLRMIVGNVTKQIAKFPIPYQVEDEIDRAKDALPSIIEQLKGLGIKFGQSGNKKWWQFWK